MMSLITGVGLTGHDFVGSKFLHVGGGAVVRYVDSVSGNNGNDGLVPSRPVATLVKAHADASDGDLIVLRATHAETLSSAPGLIVSKRVTIVGESVSGQP